MAAAALLMLAGCGGAPMRGANLLQHRGVPLDDPRTELSLQRLAATGADTVALVPFLSQSDPQACALQRIGRGGMEGLRAAIRASRRLGLRVALKPQIVVSGTWHGRIRMTREADWACWFDAYGTELVEMARLAEDEGVAMLVVGTELKGTEHRPEWRPLVGRLRHAYSGELSYVLHEREDADRFSATDLVGSLGVTLYPPLGDSPDRQGMAVAVAVAVEGLREWARSRDRPVWIAEVGIGSRVGAQARPWEWNEQAPEPRVPDPQLQASVIDLWLGALEGRWHRGVWVWNWFSDPDAGGAGDTDFTLQNKPAEVVLRCRWAGRCEEAVR